MRVLLALDGSPPADAAREAVKSIAWPEASVIRVLGVMEPGVVGTAGLGTPAPIVELVDDGAQDQLTEVVAAAARSLQQPNLLVDAEVRVGRPASIIVNAASRFRAELIVVGSRGRGPLSTMVLGSVSAEVVGDAQCAVLVVRKSLDGPVLLATDGSSSAEAAISFLIGNRLLASRQVEVLAVAPRSSVTSAYDLGAMPGASSAAAALRSSEDRETAEEVAARAAARLRQAGYRARSSIDVGDPAHRIIEAAAELGAGLVVTGSRGLTGLRRLILGSVARNVLLHSTTSVLIVHEPLRELSPERVAAARQGAAALPIPA